MDTVTVKRLAYIKYLFNLGTMHAQFPEPLNATGILMLHDSIELFNHLACEYSSIDVPDHTNFLKYWDLLSSKLSSPLPQKDAMKRLNRARVDLKHHGIQPSKLDLEAFRVNASNFFEESTMLIFSIQFREISLIDLVNEEFAKKHLHDATTKLAAGEFVPALTDTAVALQYLIADYEDRKRREYGISPFEFVGEFDYFQLQNLRPRWGYFDRPREETEFRESLGEFARSVATSLGSLGNAIKILAIGIDYPKYAKFKMYTPEIYLANKGGYHISESKTIPDEVTMQDVQFCIDFVIESAFKLQQFDYNSPAYPK